MVNLNLNRPPHFCYRHLDGIFCLLTPFHSSPTCNLFTMTAHLVGASFLTSPSSARIRGRGSNGTAILRRSSMTPFNNNNQANANPPSTAADNHVATPSNEPMPSTTSSFFPNSDSTSNAGKYSREELLQVGANLASSQGPDLSQLLMSGFHPGGFVNGNSSRAWGKSQDANGNNDPTICWNADGTSDPLLLQEMTAEEQEVGNTSWEQGALVSNALCSSQSSKLGNPSPPPLLYLCALQLIDSSSDL